MIQGQIVWFEIPVKDLDKAIHFYSEVLSVKIEKSKFLDQEYAVFNKDEKTIKGVLVAKENHTPCNGTVLYFYVIDMSESLKNVVNLGGSIITEKTLLRQKNEQGLLTFNGSLIDNQTGYYSEFIDCDGNRICLYSNS